MYNPNGLHIQNRRSLTRQEMISHTQTAAYVSHSVLDDYQYAAQLAEIGVLYPIHREYTWEPGEYTSTVRRDYVEADALQQYNWLKARIRTMQSNRKVLYNVNCERSLTDARLWLYIELMHLSAADPEGPIGFVFANESSGSESHGFWVPGHEGWEYVHSENVWTRPARIEYLKTLHRYRDVKLETGARAFIDGEHNYTYRYVNFAVNGGLNKGWGHHRDWLDTDIEINWSLPQDHLGRKFQAQMHALGWVWNHALKVWMPAKDRPVVVDGNGQAVKPPWKISTEMLIDNMDGGGAGQVVDQDMEFCCGYDKAWGYNSMRPTWAKWYPEYEAGEVLARMTEWAWVKIFGPTGFYLAGNTFTCGDTKSKNSPPQDGEGWTPHNVMRPDGSRDRAYFQYMETDHLRVAYTDGRPVQPPVKPVDANTEVDVTPPGKIDMWEYLVGKPNQAHSLSTSEIVETQFNPNDNRHCWFVKNENSEELAVFGSYIWRGTDTSPNQLEYYQLWESGTLGSKWCPRYWEVGKPFKRSPEVRLFRKYDGSMVGSPRVDVSYLELIKHHSVYQFESGVVLQDVIELRWYYSKTDPIERYFYARGYGLVGFEGSNGFKSYVTTTNVSTHPQRKTWPGITPMQLPTEEPSYTPVPSDKDDVTPGVTGQGETVRIRQFRNARNRPSLNGVDVGDVVAGDLVQLYRETRRNVDGYDWYWIIKGDLGAWVAELRDTGTSLFIEIPAPPPEPETEPSAPETTCDQCVTRDELPALLRQFLIAELSN